LINAHPVSFAKGLFTIGYDPEFEDQMGLADNPKNHALLQTKLAELGYPNSQFKFVKAEAPVGRALFPLPFAPTAPLPTAKSQCLCHLQVCCSHNSGQGKDCVRSVQQGRFQKTTRFIPEGAGSF